MKYQAKSHCEGFIFPEAPRWHRGSFYCCSIDEGTIFKINEDGTKKIFLKIDDWLSGWAFLSPESDEIILTSCKSKKLLRWNGTGEPTEVADISELVVFGINDMICTKNGVSFVDSVQFIFGQVPLDQAPKSPIIRVDAQGNYSYATDETFFPNGMVITPDNKHLLAADTLGHCIHKWELTNDDQLINHSIFASVPNTQPDGMCMDANGGVWFASATNHRVYRVIEGGEITDEVDMGETQATACMLGGEDGCTLLITASDSHDRTVIYDNPTGRLFTSKVRVPGVGLPSWY